MRVTIAAAALLVAGCTEASNPGEGVPPPPGPVPAKAGAPPPVAPPPPVAGPFGTSRWDWCGTIVNPPVPRPDDAPTEAECRERSDKALAQLRRDVLRDDAGLRNADDLPPFDGRTDPNPEVGSWIQQLHPTRPGGCRFAEKRVEERPRGLKVLASSGNMDLLGQGNLLAHDHAIGFVEAMWNAPRPVIAVRRNLPDLWIDPGEAWERTVLIIGADRLECVQVDRG